MTLAETIFLLGRPYILELWFPWCFGCGGHGEHACRIGPSYDRHRLASASRHFLGVSTACVLRGQNGVGLQLLVTFDAADGPKGPVDMRRSINIIASISH